MTERDFGTVGEARCARVSDPALGGTAVSQTREGLRSAVSARSETFAERVQNHARSISNHLQSRWYEEGP